MSDKFKKKDSEWFEGSGNIFADLELPDAQEHDIKAQLAIKLNDAISKLNCSQADLAEKLGIKQPHVSQLTNYKLQGFSVERLMTFIVKLGHSLTIQVSADITPSANLSVETHRPVLIETAAYAGNVYDAVATVWAHTHSQSVIRDFVREPKKAALALQQESRALAHPLFEKRTAVFARSTRTLQ